MNAVWPILMVASILYAIASGNAGSVTGWLVGGSAEAVALLITLAGAYSLWCGMMRILEECGAMRGLSRFLRPVVCFLLPSAKKDDDVLSNAAANISANILGLGSAATPTGIMAMRALSKHSNDGTLSVEMGMFLIINCASVQLLPTTLITLRAGAGSINPQDIIMPNLIASLAGAASGILLALLYVKLAGKRA